MKVIDLFLEKEQKSNMFDRKVNGIRYWEYIRPFVSYHSNKILTDGSEMFNFPKFSLKKYMISLKNIKKYFLGYKKYDILMVSQPRRIFENGKYLNNITDYYVDYLKEKYSVKTIEEPSYSSLAVLDRAHSFPIYTEDIYLTDFFELKMILREKLYKYFHIKKYNNLLKEYEEIESIVNNWFKGKHKRIEFREQFLDMLMRAELSRKYVKKILKKVKPKLVLLHYFPSSFKEVLINECNRQGIDTVEVMHGTISRTDPLVNKCLDISKLDNMTKYIFSFGKNQVEKSNLAITDMNNVKNTGYPFFEKIKKSLGKKKKRYILIISQSTIGDKMAKFASLLADIINDRYEIVFKYHPSEITKDYECLKNKKIIEIRREMSIYEIQEQAVLQIGSYSTALYEGFALKIPTLVIKTMFGSEEVFEVFNDINRGVYYINKPRDVLRYLDRDDIIPLDKDIKKLWQFNSKERIIKEIDKIMEDN